MTARESNFDRWLTTQPEDDDPLEDEEPDRCEADARIGTGYGVCLHRLDGQGRCPRASNHVEW